jgi:ATP-dependent Lhr-like helicase
MTGSRSTFTRFPTSLQRAIVSRLGWRSLRPVQELAGDAILAGKNVLVLAPTAGGKTEAAIFPILAGLLERPAPGVGALYIAPIKALLNNQEERLGLYTGMVGLDRFVWHGDAGQSARRRFCQDPAELLMTTPESLEVMLLSSRVPVARLFADLRAIIVDEVHALAGSDRGAHLMSVLARVCRLTANDPQRIGLSATVGNPEAILAWLAAASPRPTAVVDPPAPPAERALSVVLRESMDELVATAARTVRKRKSLLFCQSRALTEAVAERLRRWGTEVFVHHSSVAREERHAAEERFHHGRDACITCTSTLELGIDVGDLDRVLQVNAPSTVSSFLQRMGRTGRRPGQRANTTFLCDSCDSVLLATALVELARERWVEPVPPQTRCWPVLVHQVLALTLQHGAISASAIRDQLLRVPDLAGITGDELDTLLAHLEAEGYLFATGPGFTMGETAERVYGLHNFMELYAVFSSPALYRVLSAGRHELGSLEQGFVDQLVEGSSSFLLGGRAWTVEQISHAERSVLVQPAAAGKKPSWGGFLPQLLSFEVCQKIRRILVTSERFPYLDEQAAAALDARRADLGELLGKPGAALRIDDQGACWWTFAADCRL